ncbi:zinc finger BED domain-containing protein RICESLEEPER 2-like protein [Tanacetum coccineum]|uniref:Zinc finger BED domain-containing protein RICESLEEPER 2-like protein n=1 Tax=Tanacetum coccineum TaxID=301880 RepID=A0ABQ5CJ39_9ASTR
MVPEAGQSSMSRDGSVFVYNPYAVREQFAGLVIQEGLPFNHFDITRMTRVFQNHLQPKYNHVCRSTLKHDAMKLWMAAKQLVKDSFLNLNASVNVTTDVWSAPHGLPDSYRGAVFRMLKRVFADFHLEDKILSITLDNASNNTKAIGFWKAKESMFPILSRMARDMLSVQANSVAFESAFSTSGRVLSIRRTRLTPASLEMRMCLKDHLDAQDRIQNTSSLEHSLDFEEDILEAEVQDNEAIPLSDEEIALDETTSEVMSNGSGSGGEDVDLTLSDSNYPSD